MIKLQWLQTFIQNKDGFWFNIPSEIFDKCGGIDFLLRCDFCISKLPTTLCFAPLHGSPCMPVADSYRRTQLANSLIANNVQLGSPGHRHKARSFCSVERVERTLVCLNDGKGTRIDVFRNILSCIDLTLVSRNIACSCEWNLDDSYRIGSDHFPILCTIDLNVHAQERYVIEKWGFEKLGKISRILYRGSKVNINGW